MGNPGSAGAASGDAKDTLKQYGTDLTELARAGKLDPVIGREEEIRRTLQMYTAHMQDVRKPHHADCLVDAKIIPC